jgi:hypothetical protein
MAVSLRQRVCTRYRRHMSVDLAVAIDTSVTARMSARCVKSGTQLKTRMGKPHDGVATMRCA